MRHPSQLNFKEMIEGKTKRLPHVRRYNSKPVIRVESVSEHSHNVDLYCMLLATDLEENCGVDINWKFLFKASTIHDIDESMSGDVLRDVKRSSPEFHQLWNAMCENLVRSVEKDLGVEFFTEWDNDKNLDLIEGNIIALADFLAVFSYGVEELKLGNTNFIEVIIQCESYVKKTWNTIASDHPFYQHYVRALSYMRSVTRKYKE